MASENDNIKPEGTGAPEQPKHESWFKHVVDEIKEEFAELTEEAEQMDPDEFSALGDGRVHVVHNHRHDNDKKEEDKKAE